MSDDYEYTVRYDLADAQPSKYHAVEGLTEHEAHDMFDALLPRVPRLYTKVEVARRPAVTWETVRATGELPR